MDTEKVDPIKRHDAITGLCSAAGHVTSVCRRNGSTRPRRQDIKDVDRSRQVTTLKMTSGTKVTTRTAVRNMTLIWRLRVRPEVIGPKAHTQTQRRTHTNTHEREREREREGEREKERKRER